MIIKKILVVDDEPDICLTFANVLKGNGFVVDTFDDPLLALQDFRKDSYDLLIIDIKMKKNEWFRVYSIVKTILYHLNDLWLKIAISTQLLTMIALHPGDISFTDMIKWLY